jgi:hypothetical protein
VPLIAANFQRSFVVSNAFPDGPTREEFGSVVKWGALLLVCVFLLYLVLNVLGVVGSIATAPARVVEKTLGTDNIIASYEWFYDTNAQFEARLAQIKGHVGLLSSEKDAQERTRLNIELAAMRQSCRDMAAKYNGNSQKANKSLFKSRGLPEALALNACEV